MTRRPRVRLWSSKRGAQQQTATLLLSCQSSSHPRTSFWSCGDTTTHDDTTTQHSRNFLPTFETGQTVVITDGGGKESFGEKGSKWRVLPAFGSSHDCCEGTHQYIGKNEYSSLWCCSETYETSPDHVSDDERVITVEERQFK